MQQLTRTKWCTRTLLKKTNIDQFDCLRNFNRWQLADMRKFYFKKIETCLETSFNLPNYNGALLPPSNDMNSGTPK